MATKSLSSTQTKPGSPVQQCPQRVQVKRRPSWYHGSDIAQVLNTIRAGKTHWRDDNRLRRLLSKSFSREPQASVSDALACGSRLNGAKRTTPPARPNWWG